MFVIALLFHAMAVPPAAAVTCNNEQRLDGALELINPDAQNSAVGSVRVAGTTIAVDAETLIRDINGILIALGDLPENEQARVRFCPDTTPFPTAVRIDQLTGAAVGPPANALSILSLDVVPGTEAQAVVRVYGDDNADSLGAGPTDAIAFGDVNGDGFDDMVIGAPFARIPAGDAGGEVYVVYGAPQLSAASVDLNTDGAISAALETRIAGIAADQLLGYAVSCADIDGDGFDDIIMGAPNGNGQGIASGEVTIVYGSGALPGTKVELSGLTDKTTVLGDNSQERNGHSLASGDINGDGYADLIIGAPGASLTATHAGGSVTVIYGRPELRGATVDLNTDGVISTNGETRIFGARPADQTGSSVASGDINGDGFDDVIIGADHADALFTADRGATYVVYGGTALPGKIVDFSATPDLVGPAGETRIVGSTVNGGLGASVASGDINNDGFDDIVVSATGIRGAGDNFQVGEVYTVYGGADLPGTFLDLSAPAGSLGETRITGTEERVAMGFAVASSDIDGDGFDDLILGAPQSGPLGAAPGVTPQDGLVFVIRGSAGLAGQQLIDPREVADLIVVRDNSGDLWGYSVAAGGDLDRNGLPEYAAAAAAGDNPGLGNENGAGYVVSVFGAATAAATTRTGHSIAGDAPPADFGPVLRTVIDYGAGSFASTDSVTVTRSAPANPPEGVAVLPVQWQITSDRSNFSADVIFSYTDAELGTVREEQLVVYTSPTGAAGSWSSAGNLQVQNLARNEIRVTGLSGFSFFSIAAVSAGNGNLFFTLTTNRTGTGTGAVTSVSHPSGIDCGNACTASFSPGTTVTLRANPATGSSFAGWSGDCDGQQDCVLVMDADRAASADFVIDTVPTTTTPDTSTTADSGGGGGGGGCSLQPGGSSDPALPLLLIASVLYLLGARRAAKSAARNTDVSDALPGVRGARRVRVPSIGAADLRGG